jgi:hypothetical protein
MDRCLPQSGAFYYRGNDDNFLQGIHPAFSRFAIFKLTAALKPLVQAYCRPEPLKNRSQTASAAICQIKS